MAQLFVSRQSLDYHLQKFFKYLFEENECEYFLKQSYEYQQYILNSNIFLCFDKIEKDILKSIYLIENRESQKCFLYHVDNIKAFFKVNNSVSCSDLVFEPSHIFLKNKNQKYVICLNSFQIVYENKPHEVIKTARKSSSKLLIWNMLVVFTETQQKKFIIL